ncbi:MAG: hypothetical protein K0B02_04415 [DPANN group archaeon]|nr:hypothetical protein [DPANN group archaeon]
MAFKKIQRGKKPNWQKDLALERIKILFSEAKKQEPTLAKRYVTIARYIGKKFNLPIPLPYKRQFCRKCNTFFKLGTNSRHRIDSEKHQIIITCLECKNIKRIPYITEIKQKRKKQDL